MLVPVMVQLLDVDTEIPLLVGCSSTSGVEVLARLVVHSVSAAIVSSSLLRAWNWLLAGRAVIWLGEEVKWWCVVGIGSLNVTDLFSSPNAVIWG